MLESIMTLSLFFWNKAKQVFKIHGMQGLCYLQNKIGAFLLKNALEIKGPHGNS